MENGLLFAIMCFEYLSSRVVLQHGIDNKLRPGAKVVNWFLTENLTERTQ